MDIQGFRQAGREAVDWAADYIDNIRNVKVFPGVKNGYLLATLPGECPDSGEDWKDIMIDFNENIGKGLTHWQSPHFHAYYPGGHSWEGILGDMYSSAIGVPAFTWVANPAAAELEVIVMDWLAKLLKLPDEFISSSPNSRGGGMIQTTASDATVVAVVAARERSIRTNRQKYPEMTEHEILGRLVGYSSDQAHFCFEKAKIVSRVKSHFLTTDENGSLGGATLRQALEDDIAKGLLPFMVNVSLGTTGTCAFDNLEEIALVAKEFDIWVHIDAAYAGFAFICPEYRHYLNGIENTDSVCMNAHKLLMTPFDCACFWIRDTSNLEKVFSVSPIFIKHNYTGKVPDFMNWEVALGRRFRSLKLWFLMRTHGKSGLQKFIREHVSFAHQFKNIIQQDERIEIVGEVVLGLVCFRLKGPNELTQGLLKRCNASRDLYMVPAEFGDKYLIRFAIGSQFIEPRDIDFAWNIIKRETDKVLDLHQKGLSLTDDIVEIPEDMAHTVHANNDTDVNITKPDDICKKVRQGVKRSLSETGIDEDSEEFSELKKRPATTVWMDEFEQIRGSFIRVSSFGDDEWWMV